MNNLELEFYLEICKKVSKGNWCSGSPNETDLIILWSKDIGNPKVEEIICAFSGNNKNRANDVTFIILAHHKFESILKGLEKIQCKIVTPKERPGDNKDSGNFDDCHDSAYAMGWWDACAMIREVLEKI